LNQKQLRTGNHDVYSRFPKSLDFHISHRDQQIENFEFFLNIPQSLLMSKTKQKQLGETVQTKGTISWISSHASPRPRHSAAVAIRASKIRPAPRTNHWWCGGEVMILYIYILKIYYHVHLQYMCNMQIYKYYYVYSAKKMVWVPLYAPPEVGLSSNRVPQNYMMDHHASPFKLKLWFCWLSPTHQFPKIGK
jgi:hypothetical protein